MAYFPRITRLHLLASAAVLIAAPAEATTFSASSNYAFSGTQSLGTYGAGQQSIGTDFGGSAGFGGVSDNHCYLGICTGQYGADANVSVNGNIGLSVDTGFSGSQATLNYGGTATTTVSALGGGRYGIGFNAAPTSQSFSDTGAVASLAIGGSFGLSASASGEVCFYSCTGGGGSLFSFNAGGNIVSASNAGSGSLSVFGVAVPGLTLDQQKSISVLNATLNSVGGTISGTNAVSVTNPVFAASVDLVKVAAKVLDLPKTSVSVDLGIGSASLSIGSVDVGVALGLTRNDTANVSTTGQTLSFKNRKTGSLALVPVDYTKDNYLFDPSRVVHFAFFTFSCSLYNGQNSSSTHLTGSSGSGPGQSAPSACFTSSSTNFTQLQSSVYASSGALNVQVGDGSFDFSNLKISSQAAITGQVSSQRSLVIGGTISAALGTGNISFGSLNHDFGPLVNVSKTFAQTSQDLGTHSTSFGNTNTRTVIGFDGTTARAAVASVTPGTIMIGAQRVGGTGTGTITIANTALNDGFSDGLNYASAGTGGAVVKTSATGNVGPQGAAALAVGVDTSQSGHYRGTVFVASTTDGAQTGITPGSVVKVDAVTVTGNVYAPAAVVSQVTKLNLGAVRVGDRLMGSVTITNSGAAGALADTLLTGFGGSYNNPIHGNAPGPLAQGQSGTVTVGFDTSVSGQKHAIQGLTFTSHNAEMADLHLGQQQSIVLSGKVYAPAAATVTPTIDFGALRIGDRVTRNITITNSGAAGALTDTLITSTSGPPRGFTQGAAPGPLAQGQSGTLAVSLTGRTAGVNSNIIGILFASHDADQADLKLPFQLVGAYSKVYAPAVATYANQLDFGVVRVGDTATRNFAITNSAAGALTDSLLTRTVLDPGSYTHGTAPGPIAAGQTGTMAISLDTSQAGYSGGTLLLALTSHDSDLADKRIGTAEVVISGLVNNHAAPTFFFGGHALQYNATLGGYLYDAGKVIENKVHSIGGFSLGNNVTGPADTLLGSITNDFQSQFLLPSPLTVGPLGAGDMSALFDLAFHGRYGFGGHYGVFDFTGVGTNASDPLGEQRDAKLFVHVDFVPEPAAIALFGLGTLALVVRRRKLARIARAC